MGEDTQITDGHAVLALVTSVPEVCRRWHKTRKSVMMQIYKPDEKGGIIAAQRGAQWQVYIPSVIALWGPPQESE